MNQNEEKSEKSNDIAFPNILSNKILTKKTMAINKTIEPMEYVFNFFALSSN